MLSCFFCRSDRADHRTCAFVAELASARGVSFAEARRQYDEDNLVDATEARMLGKKSLEPAAPSPMFALGDARDPPADDGIADRVLDYIFGRGPP